MSFDSFQTSGNSPGRARRIAILGFGTVGSAVARRLTDRIRIPGLQLALILDRRARLKKRAFGEASPSQILWTDRFDDILASDADILVEAIGGIEPAAAWIRAALLAGKSVVTANKQVMAHHGPALQLLAARQGRQLRFEAAVGGAMPIVRAVGGGLAGDRITRIVAILNGTSNAVLSRMEATGCTIEDALADARAKGYAEADPANDVDGIDARAKLTILCALAFGLHVDPALIDTRSIRSLQAQDFNRALGRGGTIRQIAYAAFDRADGVLTVWVAPAVVPRSSIFARTIGPQNAAIVTGEYAGEIALSGAGAGGDATAVAIMSDLLVIARDLAAIVPAPALSAPEMVNGLDRVVEIVDLTDGSPDGDQSQDRSLRDPIIPVGVGLQTGPRYAEAV